MAKKNSASQVAVWVILLLLIVGLAGFGATNFGGSVNTVGSVGDREISVDRYARELQGEMNRLSQQFGTNLTFSQAQLFGIDQAVLGRILSTVALENEADALGLSAGDDRVRDRLVGISAFQGIDGNFDREGYRFALEQAGLSETEYEDALRHEMASGLLQQAASQGAAMPAVFADTLLDYNLETRDITWAVLAPDDLEAPIDAPTEDELRAYWEANPDAFMLPETRDITYAWLTPEMIAGTIEGDDAALRELYAAREDEYNQPERRLVERLVFTSEADAQSAMVAIEAGDTTFEALVAERDLALADIDLGDVARTELGAAADPVFALEEPGIVGPVETDLGPALFRMNGILAAQETPFEEAREQLLVEYRTDAARRAIGDMIDGIDDLLAGGARLEEIGEETEMEAGQIDWTEGASDGIAAYPEFREAAQDAEVGDFPAIAEASDGAIFALRLDEVIAPRVEPFEEARPEVEAAWRRARIVEALSAQADALVATLEAGEDTGPDAAEADDDAGDTAIAPDAFPIGEPAAETEFNTETGLARRGFVPNVPADFIGTVFDMDAPGDTRKLEGETAVYVIRLDAITPPDLSDPRIADQAGELLNETAAAVGSDILDAYAAAIQAQAGITLNQPALNAVHAQFTQ